MTPCLSSFFWGGVLQKLVSVPNHKDTDRYLSCYSSLVVIESEVGRLAELARSHNSYLTLSLPIHTPLLGG
jgi:hypothetical protein